MQIFDHTLVETQTKLLTGALCALNSTTLDEQLVTILFFPVIYLFSFTHWLPYLLLSPVSGLLFIVTWIVYKIPYLFIAIWNFISIHFKLLISRFWVVYAIVLIAALVVIRRSVEYVSSKRTDVVTFFDEIKPTIEQIDKMLLRKWGEELYKILLDSNTGPNKKVE